MFFKHQIRITVSTTNEALNAKRDPLTGQSKGYGSEVITKACRPLVLFLHWFSVWAIYLLKNHYLFMSFMVTMSVLLFFVYNEFEDMNIQSTLDINALFVLMNPLYKVKYRG